MKPSIPFAFGSYITSHKLLSAVALYVLVSIGLLCFFKVDICLPCLWKTLFGFECPGCGLTTAFIALIQCKPSEAFYNNPLIFVVLPAVFFYGIKDFLQFKSDMYTKSNTIL